MNSNLFMIKLEERNNDAVMQTQIMSGRGAAAALAATSHAAAGLH